MAAPGEITSRVPIATRDGRLHRPAIGWARQPLFDCELSPELPGVARWNYWCVTTRSHALTLLVADVGFAGVVLLSHQDFTARRPIERIHLVPGGFGARLADDVRGDFSLDARRLELRMRHQGERLHVEGRARTLLGRRLEIDLEIARPRAHETVNVLVPWDDWTFQYTSKQQALPARGSVRVDGEARRFDAENHGFACLDFGRGRWPAGIEWDWAFASGPSGAQTLGMNLGGRWTDGTGVNENGVVLDGRLHKIASDVDFGYDRRAFLRPWQLRSREPGAVELRFDPWRERAVIVPLGIARVELHQMMGAFTGALRGESGAPIAVDGVVGLAESLRARWPRGRRRG